MLGYIRRRGAAMIPAAAMVVMAFITLAPAPGRAASESEAAARALIVEALNTSHLVELYGDARQHLHTVLAPLAEDVRSGKFALPPLKDELAREYQSEFLKLYILADKAAEPIGAAAAKHRDEIIDDLARILAKHLSAEEIEAAHAALRLELTRKTFDSIYKLYHWAFNRTLEETRSTMLFGTWIQEMMAQYRERGNKPEKPTPSPEGISKAIAVTNQWWAAAQFDNFALSYLRVGQLVATALDDSPLKTRALTDLNNLKAQYPTMKTIWLTMTSTWLATNLTDEQLGRLEGYLREPSGAFFAELFMRMEQWLASYTQSDMDAAKTYVVAMMEKGLPKPRSAEQMAEFQADLAAFGGKWGMKLTESLSPELRDEFQQSLSRAAVLYMKQIAGLEGTLPAAPRNDR